MANFQPYNRGLDELGAAFTSTGTYQCLLLKAAGYTYDPDHDFVSDLTPASNEVSAAGYSRQTLASKTRTINDTSNLILYGAADLSFGTIATGQSITGIVLYRFITNDAASILIGYGVIDGRDSSATSPFTVALTNGIATLS